MSTFEERLRAGTALHARGDIEGASRVYEALAAENREHPLLCRQLGIVRMQQSRLDEAATWLERSLSLDDDPETKAWHGETLRRQGRLGEAVQLFEQCLARKPTFAPAAFNLGLAEDERGKPDKAVQAWLQFLSLRPHDPNIRRELGRLAYRAGDFEGAEARFREQVAAFPDDVVARMDLAQTMMRRKNWSEAIALLSPLTADRPRENRALALLGEALFAVGQYQGCINTSMRAAALAPPDTPLCLQIATAADRLADLPAAIDWFERARGLSPDSAEICNSLGVAYLNFAEIDRAIELFRAALERKADFSEAHSNLLMALHYTQAVASWDLFAEHVRWAERHAQVAETSPSAFAHRDDDPGRRLRIGYVSPRFCAGPMERLFLPLLGAHDRSRFHITCYANSPLRDAATQRMAAAVDAWRECFAWDDAQMLQRVAQDGIDILVDLSGHCPGNRLLVFARRAAPVQMTFIDYVDTTGIAAMDYFITDAHHTPRPTTQRFTEALVYMPDARFCYGPARDLPATRGRRFDDRPFAFGCFNRLSKIGKETTDTWGRILADAENARLVIKATALASSATREAVVRRFVAAGAKASQLDLRPISAEQQMLQQYNDVDVALDPFPYTGGTTTCDALSMGVPVITLRGETFAGRHATTMLMASGFEQWIAADKEQYIHWALAFYAGRVELPDREDVRAQLLGSPVCDARRYAAALEQIYVEALNATRAPPQMPSLRAPPFPR